MTSFVGSLGTQAVKKDVGGPKRKLTAREKRAQQKRDLGLQ